MKKFPLLLAGVALFAQACSTEEPRLGVVTLDLPATPYQYGVGNDQQATLGRVLFYDNHLSINNSVSCGSCHKQAFAFADNVQFSTGFENRKTSRNSMPIQNLATGVFGVESSTLFWDGREHSLTNLVLQPVVSHVEMGITDVDALVAKLENIPYYENLFKDAYGTPEVTSARVANAVSSFLRSITSTNTRLDQWAATGAALGPEAMRGKELFIEVYDCNQCHQVQDPVGYLFAGTFANIGLEQDYTDKGVENVTGNPVDQGRFKIPSLRNVARTAPYMHDGRFNTLEEVMEHYSVDIEDNPYLDPRLRDASGVPLKLNIPDADKHAIIAFLNTLTDFDMISNPKYSSPFKIAQ